MENKQIVYKCSWCGVEFVCELTEEQAKAEYEAKFGKFPEDTRDVCVVCDECYKVIMRGILDIN